MRVMTFSDYGLRVLVYLGIHKESSATIGKIAEACGVSETMSGWDAILESGRRGNFACVTLMPIAYAMICVRDSEDLRKRLLSEAGAAVLADIHFGPRVPDEGQHIRFSCAASNEAIEKGVARMADFIRVNAKAKKTA